MRKAENNRNGEDRVPMLPRPKSRDDLQKQIEKIHSQISYMQDNFVRKNDFEMFRDSVSNGSFNSDEWTSRNNNRQNSARLSINSMSHMNNIPFNDLSRGELKAIARSSFSQKSMGVINTVLHGMDTDPATKGKLEKDFFTMMMLDSPFSITWLVGLTAFGIQIVLGLLVIFDQMETSLLGTDFSIPIKVTNNIRVTQVLTIILSAMTQTDLLIGFRTLLMLPRRDKSNWMRAICSSVHDTTVKPNIRVWFFRIFFPNVLKMLQGALILVATFMIIVQSDQVVELLKDFSAMFVISTIDDLFFLMADNGYFGNKLSDKADQVKLVKIEEKNRGNKCYLLSVLILIIGCLLGWWVYITLGQENGRYVRQKYPLCPVNNTLLNTNGTTYLEIIGDNTCQFQKGKGTNILNCGWDGGDCLVLNERYPDCEVAETKLLGDKNCDGGIYNTLECGYDNGDCKSLNDILTEAFPDCNVQNPFWIGDNICHGGDYMKRECGFDGGDCIPNMSLVGRGHPGEWNWWSTVLGPDGYVYGIPYDFNKILKFNPTTYSSIYVGSDLGEVKWKWRGGVLGKDGSIYGIPLNAKAILRYDPITENTTLIAQNHQLLKDRNFAGGVEASNGNIYFMPFNHNRVVKFDPYNLENPLSEIGEDLGSGGNKIWGGVLGRDGKIYGTPFEGSRVLQIDPKNDTATFIGDEMQRGILKWTNGVVAKDGNIYACPRAANRILRINTKDQTTTFVGPDLGSESAKWSDFVAGPDGFIYGIPLESNKILIFDPILETATMVPLPSRFKDGSWRWSSAVISNDKYIYALPFKQNRLLEIVPREYATTKGR